MDKEESEIIEYSEYLKSTIERKSDRTAYDKIKNLVKDKKRFIIIKGIRGSGKTTILRNLAKEINGLIVSGDFLKLKKIPLEKVFETALKYSYKYILIDEVHYLEQWDLAIKVMVDKYKLGVIITGSSTLNIDKAGDLRRRSHIFNVDSLSFYEFLKIKGIEIKEEIREEIYKNIFSQGNRYSSLLELWFNVKETGALRYYEEFLLNPLPALFDFSYNKKVEKLREIIYAVIEEDIPAIFPKMEVKTLNHAKEILYYLAISERSSIYKLSSYTGISKDSISNLLSLLVKSGIINEILPGGKTLLKGVKKYTFNSPLFRRSTGYLMEKSGLEREDLFVKAVKARDLPVFYDYSQKEGFDFIVKGKKFEVGGKSKTNKEGIISIKEGSSLRMDKSLTIPLELFSLIE